MAFRMGGSIAGKTILVYGSSQRTSPADLRAFLRRFPTYHILRVLGEWYTRWERADANTPPTVEGVPIIGSAVPYLARLAVEASNDYRGNEMTSRDLARLFQMFHDLEQPNSNLLADSSTEAFAFLTRMGSQFVFQNGRRYELPRIAILLSELWSTVPQAKDVEPLRDLKRATGLELKQLLFYGWAFSSKAADGYVVAYKSNNATALFSMESQRVFLRWASICYSQFREKVRSGPTMSEAFDQYRFNPLLEFPLIVPDRRPPGAPEPVMLVPCPRLVFERVHRGLYYTLADMHKGQGAKNPFRTAFGYVFQEYVGLLLRNALGATNVLGERRYGVSGEQVDSVDWIVRSGDNLVLIEVKQAGLSWLARSIGDIEQMQTDLKRNVGKAVDQLHTTESAIRGSHQAFADLAETEEIERLVITYDDLNWGNSIVREFLPNPPCTFHVATISEFETLMGMCAHETFFELLHRKRAAGFEDERMDFDDWIAHDAIKRDMTFENAFMRTKFDEIFRELTASTERADNAE